jgi:hypothetical protein
MNSTLPEMPPHRCKLLWCAFWFVFLGTPAFIIMAAGIADRTRGAVSTYFSNALPVAIPGGFVAAGFTAGFLFVRLTSRRPGFVRDVVAFGLVFTVLMGVVATFMVLLFGRSL